MPKTYDTEPVVYGPPKTFIELRDSIPCTCSYGKFCGFWYSSEDLWNQAKALCLIMGITIDGSYSDGLAHKGKPFYLVIDRKEFEKHE